MHDAMRQDAAVSEVLGSILLLAIAIILAAAFVVLIFTVPPPEAGVRADLRVELDRSSAPPRVLILHQGGAGLPAASLRVVLDVNGTTTSTPIAQALGGAWTLALSNGSTSTSPSSTFAIGSALSFASTSLYGASSNLTLVDVVHNQVIAGPVVLAAARDSTPPRMTAARTTSTTSLQLTTSEPLGAASAADFTVAGASITIAQLLGNGTIVELDYAPALPTSATPVVTTSATNHGTRDQAGNALTPTQSLVAADGAAPGFTTQPTLNANVTTSTASIQWNTTEPTSTLLEYGPTPLLGLTRSNATLGATHEEDLALLAAGSATYYRVTSTDAAGNANMTSVLSFTTTSSSSFAPKNATSVTIDVASVAKGAVGCSTATLGSTTTTDRVLVTVNGQSLNDAFAFHGARISAANTLEVCVQNTTGGAVDPAPFSVYVIAY